MLPLLNTYLVMKGQNQKKINPLRPSALLFSKEREKNQQQCNDERKQENTPVMWSNSIFLPPDENISKLCEMSQYKIRWPHLIPNNTTGSLLDTSYKPWGLERSMSWKHPKKQPEAFLPAGLAWSRPLLFSEEENRAQNQVCPPIWLTTVIK